jgi:arsenate reductase
MRTTIYYNPDCGTARNTLALIRNSGEEPDVIEYLTAPPSREALVRLIRDAGLTVREAIRQKGTPYMALGLDDDTLSDAQLLDAMLANPLLINRPFVVTSKGVRLCRPSETVLAILPQPQRGAMRKEDGEPLIDASGQPVARTPRNESLLKLQIT